MIPVARPLIGEEEVEAVRDVILSGWVTQGPRVADFEEKFSNYVGAQDACAVSNCTTALHLALTALDIGGGDEVITVSSSFIATANAICMSGAKPIFVDIERHSGNIDPAAIEMAITSRTKAILVVHQIGMPCDLNAILQIAESYGIFLIEDAACAIGSELLWKGEWQRIGKPHGHIACFSFHPRKVITTGEGGMITCRDQAILARCKSLRQHAMTVSDVVRHNSKGIIFESYAERAFNYRMTDIQASIGAVQLSRLPLIIEKRRHIASLYHAAFSNFDLQHILPDEPLWCKSNWQSYCIRLPDYTNQAIFMQKLLNSGISTRRGVMCIHRESPFFTPMLKLPESEYIQDYGVILPLFHELTDKDVHFIVNQVRAAL